MKIEPRKTGLQSALLTAAMSALAAASWSPRASAQQAPPAAADTAGNAPAITVEVTETKPPKQGSAENGYRVDAVGALGPLGSAKILNLPYSIEVMPDALIENLQAQSLKDVMKYMPLVQFQEQQGSEVLRPATRGMMGSNFQNSRMDGMTVFITGGNPVEVYQQIEVLNGPSSAIYGPANPAGMFNFVTKRPTGETFQNVSLLYDSAGILTGSADLGGHFGTNADGNDLFGYRVNLVYGNGTAYVDQSELSRKLASLALDIRPLRDTTERDQDD